MTKKHTNGTSNSHNNKSMTVDDLSLKFLDATLEQAIQEIEIPEIKIEAEAKDITVSGSVDKIRFNFQLDSFSSQIILVGVVVTLVLLLSKLM